MSFETENPIVAELPKKEVTVDQNKLVKIWMTSQFENLPRKTTTPRIDTLTKNGAEFVNNNLKKALVEKNVVVIHHSDFAIVLDAQEEAYYVIDKNEAHQALSSNKPLITESLSGRPTAKVTSDKTTAYIDIQLNDKAFTHLLFHQTNHNEIPTIFTISQNTKKPKLILSHNPYRKIGLFIDKAA